MEELFNRILEAIRAERGCVVATVVAVHGSSPRKVGAKMVVASDGGIRGTIGGGGLEKLVIRDALDALKRRKSYLKAYALDKKSGLGVCGGRVSVFLEVLEPDRRLIIAGGGHIGLALSVIAKLLGFHVTVVDNRRCFANAARFPHADRVICGSYRKVFARIAPDKNTYLVLVTHGHANDSVCLESVLERDAAYIGMIGSRTKVEHVFGLLKQKGFKKDFLDRVHAPIGVDIGAESPAEIAVSIAAELVRVLRHKKEGAGFAAALSLKDKPMRVS